MFESCFSADILDNSYTAVSAKVTCSSYGRNVPNIDGKTH